jgi:hypothetical protein
LLRHLLHFFENLKAAYWSLNLKVNWILFELIVLVSEDVNRNLFLFGWKDILIGKDLFFANKMVDGLVSLARHCGFGPGGKKGLLCFHYI